MARVSLRCIFTLFNDVPVKNPSSVPLQLVCGQLPLATCSPFHQSANQGLGCTRALSSVTLLELGMLSHPKIPGRKPPVTQVIVKACYTVVLIDFHDILATSLIFNIGRKRLCCDYDYVDSLFTSFFCTVLRMFRRMFISFGRAWHCILQKFCPIIQYNGYHIAFHGK